MNDFVQAKDLKKGMQIIATDGTIWIITNILKKTKNTIKVHMYNPYVFSDTTKTFNNYTVVPIV